MWLSPRTSETSSMKPLLLVCSTTAFVVCSLPALYFANTHAVPQGSFEEYAAGSAASLIPCTPGAPAIAMAHVMPPCSQMLYTTSCAAGNPLMQRIRLDTLVTIVDAGTFIQDYASRVPLAARPDLGEGGNLRPVVDLLVEQIEWVPGNACDEIPEHLIWSGQH